jgi:bZIP factor
MMTGTTLVSTETAGTRVRASTDPVETSATSTHVRENSVACSSGVSYAVAIYPYMAEQNDEFDVVV